MDQRLAEIVDVRRKLGLLKPDDEEKALECALDRTDPQKKLELLLDKWNKESMEEKIHRKQVMAEKVASVLRETVEKMYILNDEQKAKLDASTSIFMKAIQRPTYENIVEFENRANEFISCVRPSLEGREQMVQVIFLVPLPLPPQ